MTIKTSGKLSLKEIAQELGVLASSTLGYMVSRATNIYSPKQVNKTPPHKISEFYGYNHSAQPAPKSYMIGYTVHSQSLSPATQKYDMTLKYDRNSLGKPVTIKHELRNGSSTGTLLGTRYTYHTIGTAALSFRVSGDAAMDILFPSASSRRTVYWKMYIYFNETPSTRLVKTMSTSYGGSTPDTTTTTTS